MAGELVFFGGKEGLYAVDPASGVLQWKLETEQTVTSVLASARGKIFFGCHDGTLHALDLKTRQLVWTLATDNKTWSHLAASASAVCFGSPDGSMCAVDPETGEIRLKLDAKGRIGSSPCIADGVLYFGTFRGSVHAVDLSTGEELWVFNKEDWRPAAPIVVREQELGEERDEAVRVLESEVGELRARSERLEARLAEALREAERNEQELEAARQRFHEQAMVRIDPDPAEHMLELAHGDLDAALLAAVDFGDDETVRILLDRGADVHTRDAGGNSALMNACLRGRMETVRLFLDRGARVHDLNFFGESPLLCAVVNNHTDIVDLLKEAAPMPD